MHGPSGGHPGISRLTMCAVWIETLIPGLDRVRLTSNDRRSRYERHGSSIQAQDKRHNRIPTIEGDSVTIGECNLAVESVVNRIPPEIRAATIIRGGQPGLESAKPQVGWARSRRLLGTG